MQLYFMHLSTTAPSLADAQLIYNFVDKFKPVGHESEQSYKQFEASLFRTKCKKWSSFSVQPNL